MSLSGPFPTSRQMSLIAAVAELGGVSAAAVALGISQPAVTAQLKAAEDALGSRLFVRKRSGLVPTLAGKAVATFARRQEAQRRGLVDSLAGLADGRGGSLVVGASTMPGERWLPAWLAQLRRAHPHADVRAFIGNSSETLARLLNRSVDVAVLGAWARGRGVRSIEIGIDRIVPVAARRSRFARGFASPRALADAVFVIREEGSATRACALASLRRSGITPTRLMPVSSDEAVLNMAAADLGIGMVSLAAAQQRIDDGGLAIVRIHGWRCRRRIYLSRRTDTASPLIDAIWSIATRTIDSH